MKNAEDAFFEQRAYCFVRDLWKNASDKVICQIVRSCYECDIWMKSKEGRDCIDRSVLCVRVTV